MKNEFDSLKGLVESIEKQSYQPVEIVLVDGGSTDGTIELAKSLSKENPRIKLIETPDSTPGKGRNIGIGAAANDWVALVDAGIILDNRWLESLVEVAEDTIDSGVVYGNYSPKVTSMFEKCAAIAFVPAMNVGKIRGKSVASMLIKKSVWRQVDGFPDLRAAEDLMFIEEVQKQGFKPAYAPKAVAMWQLHSDLPSTFRKFVLYSKHNVLAGRAWDWHYGIVRNYLFVLPFVILALFHSWYWSIGVLLWLAARTAKRSLSHRYEFGLKLLFNPIVFCGVALVILTIDLATFWGWIQANISKNGR